MISKNDKRTIKFLDKIWDMMEGESMREFMSYVENYMPENFNKQQQKQMKKAAEDYFKENKRLWDYNN